MGDVLKTCGHVKKEFVEKNKMFTPMDISNSVKKAGAWVSYTEVRNILLKEWDDLITQLGVDYTISRIPVNHGQNEASLYHPTGTDPSDYQGADADSMTPDEFKALHGVDLDGSSLPDPADNDNDTDEDDSPEELDDNDDTEEDDKKDYGGDLNFPSTK